jgi:hypothetical protein
MGDGLRLRFRKLPDFVLSLSKLLLKPARVPNFGVFPLRVILLASSVVPKHDQQRFDASRRTRLKRARSFV